jgi:hypothetical protein
MLRRSFGEKQAEFLVLKSCNAYRLLEIPNRTVTRTDYRSLITRNEAYRGVGRTRGVGRGLGVGSHLPMHGVGVGVGPVWTQYLPPLLV